jgi:hypothetical protein
MPLSNDIIRNQMKGMSEDIRRQVMEQIKGSPAKMGLQLSESTDVSIAVNFSIFSVRASE